MMAGRGRMAIGRAVPKRASRNSNWRTSTRRVVTPPTWATDSTCGSSSKKTGSRCCYGRLVAGGRRALLLGESEYWCLRHLCLR